MLQSSPGDRFSNLIAQLPIDRSPAGCVDLKFYHVAPTVLGVVIQLALWLQEQSFRNSEPGWLIDAPGYHMLWSLPSV